MKICEMKKEDGSGVQKLFRQCFAHPWTLRSLEDMFETGDYLSFVAKEGDKIIGYAGMKMVLDEADITNVAVLPSERQKGIAGKLLHRLLEEAEKRNTGRIFLEVRERNLAAVTLYEHAGFCEIGRRKNYYEDPREDALLMMWSVSSSY
ncbi:MAG: ribosomal protein S18-alanine N-acetyltransferase [Eubacterium sp.]|nr:ribosomal protein S18-alanine N-acetyltransferase [Eubacterium sp.]MDD7208618.1 ribosomal protein S18-alanine N-acetyltransferase [Lachnospiraceae bacterium]MDY5497399.1 ribosomal protein S18-alanine N-acetyltransferase [Anaerobutyricum sp.]